MSEMREEMLRTLDRIVEDHVTAKMRETSDLRGNQSLREAAYSMEATKPLWTALEAAGVTALGANDNEAGISFGDTMELVRRAGFHALAVPLGDAVMARRVRAIHGLGTAGGELSVLVPPGSTKDVVLKGGRLSGRAGSIPWGRDASTIVLAASGPEGPCLVAADCRGAEVMRGSNMAGEPRDEVELAGLKVLATKLVPEPARVLEGEGALLRAVQMSGALEAVLGHCLTWVSDRVQFGKPIAKHQAIQHLMAQLAEETAAGSAAADMAIQASDQKADYFAAAIAKARVGEAGGKAANLAHAIFGAMGFTREHQLHYSTRRLWAWRNEFGSEAYWQGQIGRTVAANGGGDGLWGLLTSNDGVFKRR